MKVVYLLYSSKYNDVEHVFNNKFECEQAWWWMQHKYEKNTRFTILARFCA